VVQKRFARSVAERVSGVRPRVHPGCTRGLGPLIAASDVEERSLWGCRLRLPRPNFRSPNRMVARLAVSRCQTMASL
jgi:hypothetical protein